MCFHGIFNAIFWVPVKFKISNEYFRFIYSYNNMKKQQRLWQLTSFWTRLMQKCSKSWQNTSYYLKWKIRFLSIYSKTSTKLVYILESLSLQRDRNLSWYLMSVDVWWKSCCVLQLWRLWLDYWLDGASARNIHVWVKNLSIEMRKLHRFKLNFKFAPNHSRYFVGAW